MALFDRKHLNNIVIDRPIDTNNKPTESPWKMTRKIKPPLGTVVLTALQIINENGRQFIYDNAYLRKRNNINGREVLEWHSNITHNWPPVDYYQFWQFIEPPKEWDEVASAKTAAQILSNLCIESKPPEKYGLEYAIDFLNQFIERKANNDL